MSNDFWDRNFNNIYFESGLKSYHTASTWSHTLTVLVVCEKCLFSILMCLYDPVVTDTTMTARKAAKGKASPKAVRRSSRLSAKKRKSVTPRKSTTRKTSTKKKKRASTKVAVAKKRTATKKKGKTKPKTTKKTTGMVLSGNWFIYH